MNFIKTNISNMPCSESERRREPQTWFKEEDGRQKFNGGMVEDVTILGVINCCCQE